MQRRDFQLSIHNKHLKIGHNWPQNKAREISLVGFWTLNRCIEIEISFDALHLEAWKLFIFTYPFYEQGHIEKLFIFTNELKVENPKSLLHPVHKTKTIQYCIVCRNISRPNKIRTWLLESNYKWKLIWKNLAKRPKKYNSSGHRVGRSSGYFELAEKEGNCWVRVSVSPAGDLSDSNRTFTYNFKLLFGTTIQTMWIKLRQYCLMELFLIIVCVRATSLSESNTLH